MSLDKYKIVPVNTEGISLVDGMKPLGDTVGYVPTGKKVHQVGCSGLIAVRIDGLAADVCKCKVETDGIVFECPKCGKTGFLYARSGPTKREDLQKEKPTLQAFDITGVGGSLTIKQLIGCLRCFTRWAISEGVAQDRGSWQLPQVEIEDLPKEVRDFLLNLPDTKGLEP